MLVVVVVPELSVVVVVAVVVSVNAAIISVAFYDKSSAELEERSAAVVDAYSFRDSVFSLQTPLTEVADGLEKISSFLQERHPVYNPLMHFWHLL